MDPTRPPSPGMGGSEKVTAQGMLNDLDVKLAQRGIEPASAVAEARACLAGLRRIFQLDEIGEKVAFAEAQQLSERLESAIAQLSGDP